MCAHVIVAPLDNSTVVFSRGTSKRVDSANSCGGPHSTHFDVRAKRRVKEGPKKCEEKANFSRDKYNHAHPHAIFHFYRVFSLEGGLPSNVPPSLGHSY